MLRAGRTLLALTASAGLATAAAPRDGLLTIDTLLDIKHPSRFAWSPDGRRVAFVWDRAGAQNVFVVGAQGGAPAALTSHADGLVDGLFWSVDGQGLYFERAGDLWQVPASAGGPARPVWTTAEVESEAALSPDGRRVAFARGGDLWVRELDGGREIRLMETPGNDSGPVWSPDGRRLAFVSFTSTPRDETPQEVGSKLAFRFQEGFAVDVGVVPAEGGPVVSLAAPGWESEPRWVDAARLSFHREGPDVRNREVLLADAATGQTRVLHRDFDPKWWSLTFLGADPVPSPDGRWVAFLSDADGWDHLYVAPTAGGPARQLTRGSYEVSRPAWSPDSGRIAFDANEGPNPGTRHLAVVALREGPEARVVTLTRGPGTDTGAVWRPDGGELLYQHTDHRSSADLHVTGITGPGQARRLTDSMPAAVDRSALSEPRFVQYPSADGQRVPAYLFVPAGLDRSRRHPAVVWVHGDGITQNFDGWHTRRDYAVYYSFHQYLAQRGYVVLAVDYRGSIGSGRAWRQGHFRDLGGRDYEDIAAGVAYLGTLGYVDTGRVGVWGLSYGGYMALQAVTVTPELFRCAINVAGVADWRSWYKDPDGPWIRGRLGSPAEEPDLYRRTSPIHGVDRIVRPLLVMHGTADVNVPFLESVRLVDTALKAGKDVEFVMYPGELHYFHRAHVLRDAWRRAERFFDAHLKR